VQLAYVADALHIAGRDLRDNVEDIGIDALAVLYGSTSLKSFNIV
jgi:hypothetical protein